MPPVRTLALLFASLVAAACDGDGDVVGAPDASGADAGPADAAVADAAIDPACAIAAVDAWQGEARRRFFGSGSAYEVSATVRWELVARDGCVDTFQPSGRAAFEVEVATCDSVVFDPAEVALAHDQGRLVIDRDVAPATYVVAGATSWPATRTATCGDDDVVEVDEVVVGGTWVDATGALVDDAIDGREGGADHDYAWSFAPAP